MTSNGRSAVQEPSSHRKAPSPAWPAFESKLGEALAVLEEDQYLVITEKSGWAYVQFAGQGSFGVRAECVSNNYLDEAHALRAGQMTALRRIGWSAPTEMPAEALPWRQPEGSPNFFREFDRPVPYDAAARMAVRSLAGVFESPHPGYLMYKAFDKSKRSILIPTLGLMREPPAPPRETPGADTIEGLRDLVLKAVRKASGNADLEFTQDGDLPLRFGSAAVRVRVLDGVVFAATEMFTSPFVAEHVASACLQLGSLADEYGQALQKEFGGRTAFEDARDEPEVQWLQ